VVERLKARSLIVVSPDPLDGRKLLVRTTPEGLALIDQTVPFAKQVSEQTFGGLNPAERVAIVYLLRAMTRAEDN
jgi:DNA-binding MarR family transcriptional regulator